MTHFVTIKFPDLPYSILKNLMSHKSFSDKPSCVMEQQRDLFEVTRICCEELGYSFSLKEKLEGAACFSGKLWYNRECYTLARVNSSCKKTAKEYCLVASLYRISKRLYQDAQRNFPSPFDSLLGNNELILKENTETNESAAAVAQIQLKENVNAENLISIGDISCVLDKNEKSNSFFGKYALEDYCKLTTDYFDNIFAKPITICGPLDLFVHLSPTSLLNSIVAKFFKTWPLSYSHKELGFGEFETITTLGRLSNTCRTNGKKLGKQKCAFMMLQQLFPGVRFYYGWIMLLKGKDIKPYLAKELVDDV